MNDKLLAMLAKKLDGKQWIILTETDNKREMEATSNITKMDDRRQLLAKADVMWATVIETENRKPIDRDAFKKEEP